MSRRKTERLLGLVVCLLSSPRYLTAVQIREAVPGYPESFEAFKRMFERDKEELRELGIPLETGFNSAGDDEAGYRIPRQAYVLPEIRLEPDEAAVLSLAARVWRQAELAGAAAGALLKLRAAGVEAEETTQPGIEPRLLAGEAAFGPLWEGVRDRRPVTFAYRAAGRSEAQQRHLQPWGVVNRHGRWYVAGYDTDRDAVRVFRLSRIDGDVRFSGPAGSVIVPEGTDVRETVREWDTHPPAQRTAVLRVRPGAGHGIRRHATPLLDSAGLDTAGLDSTDTAGPDGSGLAPGSTGGWDMISVPFSDVGWFAEHLASFGTDVVALEPADLREAVITQLKGALA
ncbi:MAG: DeoR family transcriptional regulator [Actinomycetia bacterium]|nr:DeoR family transcriptional regulator [Actinomycetes bacterium]